VRIDIPRILLKLRKRMSEGKTRNAGPSLLEKLAISSGLSAMAAIFHLQP